MLIVVVKITIKISTPNKYFCFSNVATAAVTRTSTCFYKILKTLHLLKTKPRLRVLNINWMLLQFTSYCQYLKTFYNLLLGAARMQYMFCSYKLKLIVKEGYINFSKETLFLIWGNELYGVLTNKYNLSPMKPACSWLKTNITGKNVFVQ